MDQIRALHVNCVQKERPKLQTRVERTGGLRRGRGRGGGGGEEQSLLGGRNYPPAHSQPRAERGCILTPPPVPKGTGGGLSSPPRCLRVHSLQPPLPWGWGESPGWPTARGKACLLTSCPPPESALSPFS